MLVRGAIVQFKGGHLRVQSADACVFLEFRGLSCIPLAPTESGPAGTGGAFIEGLLTLGLLELRIGRQDGVQVLGCRRWSLRVDVDGLRLEGLGDR